MTERRTTIKVDVLPDDPERSRFRFVTVAARRARQIHDGKPTHLVGFLSAKPIVAAMEEARRGLVPLK